MMARIAVVINADDLGMDREVNDATFGLMARGRITSATILANAPATLEAARGALRFPRWSFGVHLNLTQFEPLTGGADARALVDGRGRMSRANERATPARVRAAYRELCAQVERVASLGVRISHLDSHNHVHTRPAYFPVLKAIQKRYGIRHVRLTKTFYAPDNPCPPHLLRKKRAYNAALRSIYLTQTTGDFSEFLTYYRAEPAIQRSIHSIELMVHPGASSAADEAAIVGCDWIAGTGLPIELISYREVPASAGSAAARAVARGGLRPCA
jgi:predicted glycoside hydrolase/deacetylase ChbG (UPF0249 family)